MTVTVALVGRPNVGKSTLFNRLVGKKLALVDDRPGVTRDRREGEGHLGDLDFIVVDTAGLEEGFADPLLDRMRGQTERAIETADIILFMIDTRSGLTPADQHFANRVRRSSKPVILLANKAEGKSGILDSYEAFKLGLGDPIPMSAEHGEGLDSLYLAMRENWPYEVVIPKKREKREFIVAPPVEVEDEDVDVNRPLRIAIAGRPNVGKSTLINRLLGEDRLLTGPEAGITRDSIGIEFDWHGRQIKMFDTAGIRRRSRVEEKLEKLSVADALRAIRFAEVVVILVDATIPLEKQDLSILSLVEREGRGLVIGLNKWDLVENRTELLEKLHEEAEHLLSNVKGVALVPVSGLTGEGADGLLKACMDAEAVWNKRIPTGQLNRWFEQVLERHPPPVVAGRRIKMRYVTQIKARPPHFVVFGNQLDRMPDSYVRYLVNSLRDTFDLNGVPVRVSMRTSENPYGRKRD